MSRDRPTYLMRNTVKILVGNVLTCKAPHFKFLINFNEKYLFKLIFRDVYDSTPKQIKMSTPWQPVRAHTYKREIEEKRCISHFSFYLARK